MEPRKGAIAICSIGLVGLITSEEAHEITYPDGNTGIAWTGIQLTESDAVLTQGGDAGKQVRTTIGERWSSKNPVVIGYMDEVLENLRDRR